jgi:general secretion pathway protein N
MIAGKVAGLTLLAMALAGTIALELTTQNDPPDNQTARHKPPSFTPAPAQATEPRSDIEARVSEILARPVFSPDRRPASAGTATVAGLSRLTGIVVMGSHKVAIFAGPSGEHPVVAEEGTRVNAYLVKQITDSGVTVIGPTGTMLMTPVFDPAQPQTPKRTAPVVTPRVGGARKE